MLLSLFWKKMEGGKKESVFDSSLNELMRILNIENSYCLMQYKNNWIVYDNYQGIQVNWVENAFLNLFFYCSLNDLISKASFMLKSGQVDETLGALTRFINHLIEGENEI